MVDTERRKVLGTLVAASVGLAVSASVSAPAGASSGAAPVMSLIKPKMEKIRFGFIGVGMRGHELLRLLLAVDGVEVKALCDIHGPTLDKAAGLVVEKSGVAAALYTGREDIYKGLVERNDVDAVVIATP